MKAKEFEILIALLVLQLALLVGVLLGTVIKDILDKPDCRAIEMPPGTAIVATRNDYYIVEVDGVYYQWNIDSIETRECD